MHLPKPAADKNSQLPESLGSRLKLLAQMRSEISAAQLQIINLKDVAAAFGDRWESVRTRVFNTALHFVKRRVAELDTLIPCSDGFIVIFGEAEGQAAELAGHRLAEALSKFFVGEAGFGDCQVAAKHMSLGLDELDDFIRSLSQSSDDTAIHGVLPEEPEQPWEYKIRFRPVSDVKKNFIVTYFTEPVDLKGRRFFPDDSEIPTAAARRAFVSLDLATIAAGMSALRKVVSAGGRIIVGLTVHIDSLTDQTGRHIILDALGRIEPELRRYTTITLARVPPGFPRFHLDEHVRLLHQKRIRLGLDLSIDDPNPDILQHPFLTSFGYYLSPNTTALFRDQHNPTVMQLRSRSRRLHEAGKRLALIADGTPNIMTIVNELEADYVSSLDLWPLRTEPASLHPA